MNRKRILIVFSLLILFFSISSVHSADVNITDCDADTSLSIDGESPLADVNLDENTKNQTEITVSKATSYGYYSVTLKDSSANCTLENKTLSFTANNADYNNLTDSDGVSGVYLNLKPGSYVITSSFSGDDDYLSSNVTSNVKILATVQSKDVSKYYGGAAKYTATFYDFHGNLLKGTSVNITVNGKTYSQKTSSKGVVSMAINLKPGTYKVSAVNPVTGYVSTTTFKILTTISSSDFKKVKGDSRKFTVKFFKANGKALAGKYVKIKVAGKTQKVKTSSYGKVRLSLNNLKKGTYKVISYNTDGLSRSQTVVIYNIANTKITVNTSSFHTFLPDDKRIVKIKFTNSIGGDTNAGKTIKINIDGKTYSRKTDSNGIINFKLPVDKGFFTITYTYAGDSFFKSFSLSNQLTLLKTTQTTLKVKSTTNFGYGADTLLKVALTAGGVTLAKKKVTFKIQGKTYTDTTDNKGIASVPITLNIGNYTVSYSTPSDSMINGTSASSDITVFKRAPSKLTWKCGVKYKDNLQTFKVFLANSKGKLISGGNIELTIDGETHTGKTASNGYATIKTAVAIGKYKVSVKFTGSNDYLPTTISKTINVELSKFGYGLNQKSASASNSFLQSSSYCPVNNAKIKAILNSITDGLTNKIDKAKAIFNYVRDNVSYSYYYNSHKGAVSTLNSKSANCADQAHLLVSMYRTAGFKARYVHGICKFSDGTFGHVWTQVLIDGKWVCGDPINYKNALGKINNWNTNSYQIRGVYRSLPF